MNPEYDVETVEELINSLAAKGGNYFAVGFDQNSITELNGTYSVRFICVLDDHLPSQFGDPDVGTLPLTAEEEYSIQPTFEFVTAHPDAVFTGSDIHRATSYSDEVTADTDLLEMVLSEVHLTEDQLLELIGESDSRISRVEHIGVSAFTGEQQGMVALTQSLASEQTQLHTQAGEDLTLVVTFKSQPGGLIDELRAVNRYGHVETITIDGNRYPVTVRTMPFNNWQDDYRGQFIHTSDFLANNTEVPKIDLRDELKRIEWDEFFASERPWPESPQHALNR